MNSLLFNFRYEIVGKLGEGAQGQVSLARDTITGALVAIKVLHCGQTDSWRSLFKHEFEILADQSHPYLAQVHDFGVTADSEVYFTRDYVTGVDLLTATQKISARQFVAVCVQICRALRPLHRSGLIHGDIKPGNLLFGEIVQMPEGSFQCSVWPIDFSFVRPANGSAAVRGTLQYIAPEILQSRPVDVRSDLYSLGVAIFEAACGSFPFEGDVNSVIQEHLSKRPPRLIPTRILSSCPEDEQILQQLPDILDRLLCYHPHHRFPDIDELEAALTSLCPAAVVSDNESYVPSRNVLANKDGFSKKIFEKILQRRAKETDIALFVVEGEVGSGRSAVRKAVKWQAQLEDFVAIEISFGSRSDLFSPISMMLSQVAIVLGGTSGQQRCMEIKEQIDNFAKLELELTHVSTRVAALIAEAARKKSILLTVENIERAPGEALGILREILAQTQSVSGLVMLATCVPDFSWPDLLGHGTSFFIPMLNEAEIAGLVRQYLGIDGAPVANDILVHTGGNPLFVTRLLSDCVKTSKSPKDIVSQTVVRDIQTFWQQRMAELTVVETKVLIACAVLNQPADAAMIANVADLEILEEAVLSKLCKERWLQHGRANYCVRSTSLALQVMQQLSATQHTEYSKRAFEVEKNVPQKILHAAKSNQIEYLYDHAIETIRSLETHGALTIAKELLYAVLDCSGATKIRTDAQLMLGRVEIALGEHDSAAQILGGLVSSDNLHIKQSALRYLGKIAVQQTKLDEAAVLLERALNIGDMKEAAPSIFYELCEIEFRRGRYPEAVEVANQGLDLLDECSDKRANLLCSKAKGFAAQGNHDVAMVLADEAVALATQLNQKQEIAFAIDVRAWVLSLQGNIEQSTLELEKCAQLYREVGDTARLARSLQVIGNNYWWLEQWAMMLKKHKEAMRVATSLDNPVGRNEQLIAYGYALNCIGRFEKASLVLHRAEKEARRLNNDFQILKVSVYQGDWNAWQGKFEKALECWNVGYKGFKRFSNYALLAELALEMAGAHTEKKHQYDLDAAQRLIGEAESYSREDFGRHFEHLLSLTIGQLHLARGEFEKGSSVLEELIVSLRKKNICELQWQAHLFLAEAMIEKNLFVMAKKKLRESERILFVLADGLPAMHQISFWQDARRAKVRRLLHEVADKWSESAQFNEGQSTDREAANLYKVLAINKQISRETDVDVLMVEILDAAIELTGAERGFFLSKAKEGLVVRAAREMSQGEIDSPYQQFSSSIAESVYLDKEPVVTVDAASDNRFNEFLSIHHLQIKSVACLPIAYRAQVLGVLYLENRLAKGTFNQTDVRVLSAFSDQMAIALAQAKAIDNNVQVQKKLEETAAQLQDLVNRQSQDLKTKQAGLELAKEQLIRIKQRVEGTGNYQGLIGSGKKMQRVFDIIERVKNNDIPVTIVGPSGSGKDAVARVIHDVSRRQHGPFVSLACGAMPENLVESTLFGHKQGAFSGAGKDTEGIFGSAIGGTLYLDDIAEMPKRMQVDLLRVLQEGTFVPLGGNHQIRADFRLLCSSKVALSELVDQGILRSDLYYRLQVVSIELPPLRDRKEDIPVLAAHIAKTESANLKIPYSGMEPSLLDRFMCEPWEGNVRELEQCIRRALVIGQGDDLLRETAAYNGEISTNADNPVFLNKNQQNEDEKSRILAALERAQWNKTRAAQYLDMPRRTFYRRLKFFDIV